MNDCIPLWAFLLLAVVLGSALLMTVSLYERRSARTSGDTTREGEHAE